jgi:ABC-type multidrug transport system ATPase subunit
MPSQLSSGQRKLVGVSRALVAKPKLPCLDEPAAGLDMVESEELGVTLRRLADQGQGQHHINPPGPAVIQLARLPLAMTCH